MALRQTRRYMTIGASVLALLIIIGATGMHLAARSLRAHIVQILGPTGHAAHITVGFSRITLDQVVIKAPAGWPAEDTLRARRVTLEPDFWQLLSHRLSIRHAELDDVYLSVLRTADGKISLLPNLRDSSNSNSSSDTAHEPNTAAGTSGTSASTATTGNDSSDAKKLEVDLGGIDFKGGTLDFFDATVAKPPFRLRMTSLQAAIGRLHFPLLKDQTSVSIAGNIVGPKTSGPLNIDGWIVFGDAHSDIRTRFSHVDVNALSPYIDKQKVLTIDGGLIGLDAHSVVENQHLQANGTITLDNLELAQKGAHGGALSVIESVARQAAITALQDKNNRITLAFTLDGNLSDPSFSLNEGITTRFAAGLAKALGISAEGVARSVGDTTRGLGGALLNLIGK